MNEREKLELAEVFSTVLEARMQELYTQIAAGFVEILNCLMEDLAKVMEDQNRPFLKEVNAHRATKEWLDKVTK